METVECSDCKSVMGLVKETPRWKVHKCFSCRRVMGQLSKDLNPDEREDAEREMDSFAESLLSDDIRRIGDRLRNMSPQELQDFFKTKDSQK
ncbi:MAG TPA: hypothetical protein VFI02_12595 [Armatimonadota bacterium]|nr:hypothetical protein [Armatimonadota bacterium]